MPYPFWDIGLGYGVLMAVVAVVHVFLSHFAIGGGLYLVCAEHTARKAGDAARLAFVRDVSRFFILATVVLGALTGVAIWFVIGLLNPSATLVLIRNFVWGWAIEWTFFMVEILAAILYWYGWDRLAPRAHLAIGWIYFVFAWLSLVVINGIITFMLTPGAWLQTGSFWDGFLNPTYWPSLALRTGICVLLAGLFTLLVASWSRNAALRPRMIRYNAIWGLVGLAIAVPSLLWYRAAVPADVLAEVTQRLTIPGNAVEVLTWLTAGLAAVLVVLGLALPRYYARPIALAVLVLGLAWFGSFEWWRESARKPWAIHGYTYGNGLHAADVEESISGGLLPEILFRTGDDGADLFRTTCRHCHTVDGYNPIAPAFAGTDEAFVQGSIRGLHAMRGLMPRFPGTADEAGILGSWIWRRMDQRSFREVHALDPAHLGERIYEVRCGRCHVRGGHNDKTASLAGEDEEFYRALLTEELTEEMPVFSGPDEDLAALIAYLKTLEAGE